MDGSVVRGITVPTASVLAFSFVYDSKPSGVVLPGWRAGSRQLDPQRVEHKPGSARTRRSVCGSVASQSSMPTLRPWNGPSTSRTQGRSTRRFLRESRPWTSRSTAPEGMVQVFRRPKSFCKRPVRMRGLDSQATYLWCLQTGAEEFYGGRELLERGLRITLAGTLSTQFVLPAYRQQRCSPDRQSRQRLHLSRRSDHSPRHSCPD